MNQGKQNNIRIYPLYKILSWDLLFYYAISFLFLTQIKGISASNAILVDAIYCAFKLVVQIPCNMLTDRFGKRNTLIAGNVLVSFSILLLMLSNNFTMIILSQLISAIGFDIKAMAESNILYDSIPDNNQRGKLFSKIDGKATSLYYYIDAITSIATGFLFVINGYLPMVICFLTCILATIVSTKFTETEDLTKKKEKMQNPIKELKYAFRDIMKSKRLKMLLLYYGIMSAILNCMVNLRSSLLTDLAVPEQYFGIIFAVLQILSGFGSKNQERIHNRYRNKALAYIGLPVTGSCILIGFVCMGILPANLAIGITLTFFIIQYIAKGIYYILIGRYLNNFTNQSIRTKIASMKQILYGIFSTAGSLLASFLLGFTSTAITFVIIGCIFTIILVLILDKMKTRVGLKPEQYPKEDIKFVSVK